MSDDVGLVDAEPIHDRHDIIAGDVLTIAGRIFRYV